MVSVIPDEVLSVCKTLEKNNFESYLVGGSVRDIILKRKVKDWDLTTNATPDDLTKIFKDGFYNNEFGTVGVPATIDNKEQVIEITTFRTEKSSSPTHKPDKVTWGKTIEEDLARRDFTINAIALKIIDKPQAYEIIDPYNGEKDISKKIIKAVGDANLRFKEDALRLLRAIRIATELEFKIEQNTWDKIVEDAPLIEHISSERIRTELLRIIVSKNAYDGVILLKDSGMLKFILP